MTLHVNVSHELLTLFSMYFFNKLAINFQVVKLTSYSRSSQLIPSNEIQERERGLVLVFHIVLTW